jgi:hypothetical protein
MVTTAKALGVVFDRRRLELKGSRGLQSCSICPPIPPQGHWCWVKRGSASRRLTDENAYTTTQTAIQAAAAMPEYDCLGAAEDLEIIFHCQGE